MSVLVRESVDSQLKLKKRDYIGLWGLETVQAALKKELFIRLDLIHVDTGNGKAFKDVVDYANF